MHKGQLATRIRTPEGSRRKIDEAETELKAKLPEIKAAIEAKLPEIIAAFQDLEAGPPQRRDLPLPGGDPLFCPHSPTSTNPPTVHCRMFARFVAR